MYLILYEYSDEARRDTNKSTNTNLAARSRHKNWTTATAGSRRFAALFLAWKTVADDCGQS